MISYIKQLDILGYDIHFNYNRSRIFRTQIGTVLSLVIIAISIASFYFFGKELVIREFPFTIFYDEINNDQL